MKRNTCTFAELINFYQSKQRNSKSKNINGVILDVCYANKDTRKRGK